MKKSLKILSIGFAALLILVLLSVLLLTSSPGENLIRGWLERRLTAEIGLPVKIKQLETNLWSHVQIDGLTVNSRLGPEQQPIVYIQQVHVGYSIRQLLGEIVTIKTLAVDSVALAVELDSLGHCGIPLLDAPAPVTADSGAKTGFVCIDSVSIDRVGLYYFDSRLPLSVNLAGATLRARGTGDGAFFGRLTVDNISAVYDSLGLDFDGLDISAALDKEMLHLESATAHGAGLQLEAAGDLGLAASENIALVVSVDGSLDTLFSALAASFGLPALRAGRLNAQGRIEGTFNNPDIKLQFDARDLGLEHVDVQSAMLQAQYYNDQLLVDTFRISTLNGTLAGSAGAVLDTLGACSLNVSLDKIDLASLWQSVYGETSPYRGIVSGLISAQGRGRDVVSWTAAAAITGEQLRYADRPIPNLTCSAKLAFGRTDFSLVHGADTIHADLEFAKDSLRGVFAARIPDLTALARWIDQPELAGRLWAEGTLNGAYSNVAFRSTVHGSRISYRNFPVDSMRAELSYEDGSLTVIDLMCGGGLDSIDARHPPFGLDSIAGSVAYMCRLRGPADSLSGDFFAFLDKPRYGSYALDSLSIHAACDGSHFMLTELKASRGELGARLRASYDTTTTSGSFDLLLHTLLSLPVGDRGPVVDSIDARDDLGSISGTFAPGSRAGLSATVHGQGLRLSLLPLVTGDTSRMSGEINFDLAVDGPYLTPNATVQATARSVKVADFQIDSLSTHLRLAHQAIILDSLISYAWGHTLQAAGRLELDISPDGLFEIPDTAALMAELRTTDFDLSAVQGLILPGGELSGLVSAAIRMSGTIAAPRLNGRLSAEKGRVLLAEGSLPLDNIALSLTFADSVFTIDSASGTVAEMAITASGSLTTSTFTSAAVDLDVHVGTLGRVAVGGTISDTSVNLQMLSDSLNLAVFQPFVTEFDSLAGRLGCRLLVVGKPAAPQINGSLRISALSFQAPRSYAWLSDGYADVRFDGNRVVLDSAVAALNGGSLAVSGVIEHAQGELVDVGLTLHADSITVRESGTYILAVDSAALSYGRQQENYVLDGDIFLGETRFTAGLRPTSILPWVKSMETVDLELPEFIARSRLDVRIRESDQLWVDNNLARIRLRAALGIIGTPLRPNFTGLLQIEEGYLLYLDRRFLVNEGTVYFNDPTRFNPDINLDASTTITVYRRTAAEPYTVSIKAEGLLDQLQYGMSSDPPLEKPDIVALLTLGATRSELAGGGGDNGEGGLTGVLKDRAAMLASEKVSGYLSRRAGSFFGFNEFTIQGNLFKFDETWGPQLVASNRLSQRVDFTYSTTVGHLNDQSVRLGYRLTSRLSLQGETDRQGRAGLDLKYGFTFK